MSALSELRADLDRIQAQHHRLRPLRDHWNGKPPTAYLSPKSRKSIGDRLPTLGVNFPRLLVTSYVDRLNLSGFTGQDGKADAAAWDRFRTAGLVSRADQVHTDRLLYGAAYVTVWPERTGPAAVLDNPYTMHADVDPLDGRVRRAVRWWRHKGQGHALVIEPDHMVRWTCDDADLGPAGQWTPGEATASPWATDGLVPVVPFIRRVTTDDYAGTSVAADILGLTDAENKIIQDAMVTSEDYARPRRWATGLEIQVDEDGRAIDPFGRDQRTAQSEDPETKFGQFESARLDSYADMSATITQLVGAMTGLPAHYLGLHGDQPAAAEGVRAAEAQLTSRCYSEIGQLDEPWSATAALLALAADRGRALPPVLTPTWESPEIRTPAQAADAATKLAGIGVPLSVILTKTLGWSPNDVRDVEGARRGELIERAAAQATNRLDLS